MLWGGRKGDEGDDEVVRHLRDVGKTNVEAVHEI
jgi:hypothetical protein